MLFLFCGIVVNVQIYNINHNHLVPASDLMQQSIQNVPLVLSVMRRNKYDFITCILRSNYCKLFSKIVIHCKNLK